MGDPAFVLGKKYCPETKSGAKRHCRRLFPSELPLSVSRVETVGGAGAFPGRVFRPCPVSETVPSAVIFSPDGEKTLEVCNAGASRGENGLPGFRGRPFPPPAFASSACFRVKRESFRLSCVACPESTSVATVVSLPFII